MVAPPNPEKVALLGNEGAAPARATGGWARVLGGAATLGTMAVAATLATHPGLASTLGAGLALPPVPSTGDLSATSVRPVAGMGSGPARTQEVEVSTADPVVAVASLGRSPHRAAPSHREIAVEPHRDRQYLVPDIVISELSAKLGKNRGERTRCAPRTPPPNRARDGPVLPRFVLRNTREKVPKFVFRRRASAFD
jgi:hypothetical protein